MLGERVLQFWWWYLHWYRRYRKKTRGWLEIAPPLVGRGLRNVHDTPKNNLSSTAADTFGTPISNSVSKWMSLRIFDFVAGDNPSQLFLVMPTVSIDPCYFWPRSPLYCVQWAFPCMKLGGASAPPTAPPSGGDRVQSTRHVLSDTILHSPGWIGWWGQGQHNEPCLVRALASDPANPLNQNIRTKLIKNTPFSRLGVPEHPEQPTSRVPAYKLAASPLEKSWIRPWSWKWVR